MFPVVETPRYCKIEGCTLVMWPGDRATCSHHRSPVNRKTQCSNSACTKRQLVRMSWCSVDCYMATTDSETARQHPRQSWLEL